MSRNDIRTVVILACLTFTLATDARSTFSLNNGQNHMLFAQYPRAVDDGICTTMIETWGYICEEHKVWPPSLSLSLCMSVSVPVKLRFMSLRTWLEEMSYCGFS